MDVAPAVAAILENPAAHIGHIYNLTGPESADLDHYARVFSEMLGRTIRYRDVPTSEWSGGAPIAACRPPLTVMTELHKQGRHGDFMRFAGIVRPEGFGTVTWAHVIAWRDRRTGLA